MNKRIIFAMVVGLMLLVLLTGCGSSSYPGMGVEVKRGTIEGVVTANGAAVKDAVVSLSGKEGLTATTDASGKYSIRGVYEGTYYGGLRVKAAGYDEVFSAVIVKADQTTKLDVDVLKTGTLQISAIEVDDAGAATGGKITGVQAKIVELNKSGLQTGADGIVSQKVFAGTYSVEVTLPATHENGTVNGQSAVKNQSIVKVNVDTNKTTVVEVKATKLLIPVGSLEKFSFDTNGATNAPLASGLELYLMGVNGWAATPEMRLSESNGVYSGTFFLAAGNYTFKAATSNWGVQSWKTLENDTRVMDGTIVNLTRAVPSGNKKAALITVDTTDTADFCRWAQNSAGTWEIVERRKLSSVTAEDTLVIGGEMNGWSVNPRIALAQYKPGKFGVKVYGTPGTYLYKFVLIDEDGNALWQEGDNRTANCNMD